MAKALLAAKVLGQNPRKFDGRNVRVRVLQLVAPTDAGFEAGRLRDTGDFDNSNTFSQSLGVLGLARTGGVPQDAVDYLLKQQCADGYFRISLVAGQSCNTSASLSDVDATAMAVQALVAAKKSGAVVKNARVTRAGNWLVSVQKNNGAFGGSVFTPGANSQQHRTRRPGACPDRPRQGQGRGVGVCCQGADHPGAGRFGSGPARRRRAGLRPGGAAGCVDLRDSRHTADQFRRATAQAIFGLVSTPLGTLKVKPRR